MKTSPFLKNNDPELDRAEAVFEKPEWLEGHKTQIGLAIIALGTIGNWLGFKFPVNEVQNLFQLVLANWDGMAQIVGVAFAIYGLIKKAIREKRLKKAVVVQAVLKDRVQEKLDEKKDELIETRTQLHEAKAELKKATE